MAYDPMFTVLVLLNAALSGYGAWQMVHGWQLKRRGKDKKQLVMAGAARLLLSSGMWVVVVLLSAQGHRFGSLTGRIALGICVALIMLSMIADNRRKRLMRRDT